MRKINKLAIGAVIAALAITLISSQSQSSKSKTKKIVLTKDNTIILNDAIDSNSVAEVITKAKKLDNGGLLGKVGLKKKDSIYIFLRTPGGEVQAGLEMIEALKGLNRPVDTIAMFAASMGFQTAQQLGKRYIVKNGVLMSHRARGGFEGEFGGQRPSQVDSRKGLWESRMDEMDQQTVDRTGGKQTMESYQKAYASELWVTGSQAIEKGYADAVVNVQCDSSLSGVTTKKIMFMGIIPILYDVDNCPLNSAAMNVRIGDIDTNKGKKSYDVFLSEGGDFGSSCLASTGANPNKLCALNTNLSVEKIEQLKQQFKTDYTNIKDRTISLGIN